MIHTPTRRASRVLNGPRCFRGRIELGVLALITVSYWLVFPIGEYAVLDDWAYVKSLAYLHDDGELRILDWNPMSLVGLLFWAWPFTKIAGFSFTVTKISVVALFAIECLALVRLLRLCDVSPGVIFGAVTSLIFNPLHFVHCFMFMTDIPAIAWELLAVLCYVTAFTRSPRRSYVWLGLGSLTGAMSFLIRQNGLLVHLAFLAYIIVCDRGYLRWRSLVAAFGPACAVAAVYEIWYLWGHHSTSTFESSAQKCIDFLLRPPLADVPHLGVSFLMYLGLFLFPLSLAMPWQTYRLHGARRIAFAGITCLLTNLFVYDGLNGRLFPYFKNVMSAFGFFRVNEFIVGERELLWGRAVAWLISIGGFVSILALVNRLCACAAPIRTATIAARALKFLLMLLGLELAYCVGTKPILFDRHLLIMAPTVLSVFCLLCHETRRLDRTLLFVGLAPMAFYSVAATHDLHAISRAAFRAGDDLIARGVPPNHILGGYAFDGWSMYERSTRNSERLGAKRGPWWVREVAPDIDAKYVVAVSMSFDSRKFPGNAWIPPRLDLSHYDLVKTYSYRGYWPWGRQYAYVLKRHPSLGADR